MRTLLVGAIGVLLLSACETAAAPAPQPSVGVVGSTIRCSGVDHAIDDPQLGWGFCYPGSWRFRERAQQLDAPTGVDTTFDIVDASPRGSSNSGKTGFMILGTYELGPSSTLQDWLDRYVDKGLESTPIEWGNARESVLVAASGRRYARTPHHVIVLEIRGGGDNLDVEGEMAQRLKTWKFVF